MEPVGDKRAFGSRIEDGADLIWGGEKGPNPLYEIATFVEVFELCVLLLR
jgi:hypothetical protein